LLLERKKTTNRKKGGTNAAIRKRAVALKRATKAPVSIKKSKEEEACSQPTKRREKKKRPRLGQSAAFQKTCLRTQGGSRQIKKKRQCEICAKKGVGGLQRGGGGGGSTQRWRPGSVIPFAKVRKGNFKKSQDGGLKRCPGRTNRIRLKI